jgi:hypothetical protein
VKVRYQVAWGHTVAHVARFDAFSDAACDRIALCGGLSPVCIVGTWTPDWPDDPFADVIDVDRQVTCRRCAERYERAFAAAQKRGLR